jgi:hypothetical protein
LTITAVVIVPEAPMSRNHAPRWFKSYLLHEHHRIGKREEGAHLPTRMHDVTRSEGKVTSIRFSDAMLGMLERAVLAARAEVTQEEAWKAYRWTRVEVALRGLDERMPRHAKVLRWYILPKRENDSVEALAYELNVGMDGPRRMLKKAIDSLWFDELGDPPPHTL